MASGFVVVDELGIAPSPEWLSDEFERAVKRAEVKRVVHGREKVPVCGRV
jgi:hypothetical protein